MFVDPLIRASLVGIPSLIIVALLTSGSFWHGFAIEIHMRWESKAQGNKRDGGG
jgi:hypothetical protein